MRIKTYIQSKINKADIPRLQDLIMSRMKDIDLIQKKKRKLVIHPFFALKLISSFMIILGLSLVILPLFDSEVEAFTSYDEVMILSSTSVYALYETYISPVEDDVSFAHVMTLRSQLKTMITYAYTFERLIQTEGNFNIEKSQKDTRYQLYFEAEDGLKDRLPFQMEVEKAFKNDKRDQFAFAGQFQLFEIEGDVIYDIDRHILKVSYVKESFQVRISYDNKTSQFDVDMYTGDEIIQSFSYYIDYDLFERPTLHMSYDHEGVSTNVVINRSIISKEMTLSYTMLSNGQTFKGLITINIIGGLIPRYTMDIPFEDGETIRFQFIRPKTIRDNRMPITNNVIFKNVL